jgi:cytochrome c-type biogenesis protein CcmH
VRALFIAVFALLLAAPALALPKVSFEEIEESLTCQCGCGLTVRSCNHVQCGSALPLRKEIREEMDKGLDKKAILAYFAEKYGEKILSSPTTKGFNLAAWITPFMAVGIGAALVVLTLRRWHGQRVPAVASPSRPAGDARSSEYEKILDKELDRFDG